MSQLENAKNQINIDATFILNVPKSRFNPQGGNVQPLPGYDNERVTNLLTGFFLYLEKIKLDIGVIDRLPLGAAEGFQSTLTNIRNEITGSMAISEDVFTSQHHNTLNLINSFVTQVYQYSLPALLSDKIDIKTSSHKGLVVLTKALENEDRLSGALTVAEKLIASNRSLGDSEIEALSGSFNELSKKYGSNLNYLYLATGLLILIGISLMSFFYFDANDYPTMNFYQYLFYKITLLVIPLIISVFSINQFLHFRKLKEFYEDKDYSLKIMRGLLKSYNEDRPKIIEIATNKIFSDFKESKDSKITENTILKLIELAKK